MLGEANLDKARKAEQQGQYFNALIFYKSALQEELKKEEKIIDKIIINECKTKLVEMGEKSSTEFKEIVVDVKIPREEARTNIQPILDEKTLDGILVHIARSRLLIPIKSHVDSMAKSNMPISYQIFGVSTISKKGHLIANSDDPSFSWYMNMYTISEDLIRNMYLDPIFEELEKLIEKERLFNAESLMKFIVSSPVVPPESLPLISVGIKRYFEEDYISALHVLVPQFENLFIQISERVGIDVITINRTKGLSTNTKVLSVPLLDSEPCKQNWGEDLCELLKFILLEPLGYKLRHKVAHGEITESDCNKSSCNLIIYLILVALGRIECK